MTALLIKRKYKEVVIAYFDVLIRYFLEVLRKTTKTFLRLADLCYKTWDRTFRKYKSWSLSAVPSGQSSVIRNLSLFG